MHEHDLLPVVRDYDFVIAVDAVDVPDAKPGTVYRFAPDEIGGHGIMQSLHDLRLIDLIQAATLLGYECDGMCFGVQVENMSPATLSEGLTPDAFAALPLLVDCVLAQLIDLGVEVRQCGRNGFRTADRGRKRGGRPVRRYEHGG